MTNLRCQGNLRMHYAFPTGVIIELSDDRWRQMNGIGVYGLDFQLMKDVFTKGLTGQFVSCIELIGSDAEAVHKADRDVQFGLNEGVEGLPLRKDVAEDAMDGFDSSLLIGGQWITVENSRTADPFNVFLDVFWLAELRSTIG